MQRRIIQIAAVPIPAVEGEWDYPYARLYALCDDGSLWWRGSSKENSWHKVKEEIPES